MPENLKIALEELSTDEKTSKMLMEFLNYQGDDVAGESLKLSDQIALIDDRFSKEGRAQIMQLVSSILEANPKARNTQFNSDNLNALFEENLTSHALSRSLNERTNSEFKKQEESLGPEAAAVLKARMEMAKKAGGESWIFHHYLMPIRHAGWKEAQLPEPGKPGIFKATRTLGMANDKKVAMAEVLLDFSSFGPIDRENARNLVSLLDTISKIGTGDIEAKRKTAFDEYFGSTETSPNRVEIEKIITDFVESVEAKTLDLQREISAGADFQKVR